MTDLNTDIKAFAECGHIKFNVEDEGAYKIFEKAIQENFNKTPNLNSMHEIYSQDKLNDHRLAAFRSINNIADWPQKYFKIAHSMLERLLGVDLLIQNKLNLSVQMPKDKNSQLALHTDTLSGQSEFEVVLWVPFTKATKSNSMFLFNLETTKEIYKVLPDYEERGMNDIYEKFKNRSVFVELNIGEALIFSPTLFHGNIENETNVTRVSVNCRFKSLFSPEFETFPTERRAGPFYRILQMSPVTSFALKHDDSFVKFNNG